MPATMTAKRGRPAKPEPRKTFSVSVPQALNDALEAFIHETDPRPVKASVIEFALRAYLTEHGYWPPKDEA